MGQQRVTAHAGQGGGEEGGMGRREEEERESLDMSQSGSYIRGSQVGRGGRGAHRGREDTGLRETSGSLASERGEYTENRDKWVSRGQPGAHQHRTIITTLQQTSVMMGTSPKRELSDLNEDYVDMKSVSGATQHPNLRVMKHGYTGLAQLIEEDDHTDGDGWADRGDPADYERPVSAGKPGEREETEGIHLQLGHKGDVLSPSLSGAVARAGPSHNPTNRSYINIDVKKFDPSMELFCSSEHHKKAKLEQSQTITETAVATHGVEEISSSTPGRQYADYINIDADSLPPENAPIPKNSE